MNPIWFEDAPPGVDSIDRDTSGRLADPLVADWARDGVRTMRLNTGPDRGTASVWAVNTGGRPGETPTGWFVEGARQFLETAAADALNDRRTRRSQPLLGLPLVGTAMGGAAGIQGELIEGLLSMLDRFLGDHDVDVVLVIREAPQFDAVQTLRKRLDLPNASAWPVPESRDVASRLADLARAGRLVLFLGAGVSVGAELPTWRELVVELATRAGIDPDEARSWNTLDLAELIKLRLARTDPSIFARYIEDRFSVTRRSLTHCILASLPINESVTTNYDVLFEEASRDAGVGTAVLPYEGLEDSQRWLLKMHGTVTDPENVVLSRSDYLRYGENRGALRGIVQAMLITRHMLFVGFSLSDDNFLRIADDVRRAIRPPEEEGSRRPFGTALTLRPEPLMSDLWAGDIDTVAVASDELEGDAEAARAMEIYLDLILTEASTTTHHVLDPSFDGVLDDGERWIRRAVTSVASDAPDHARRSPAWREIEKLLDALGRADGSD